MQMFEWDNAKRETNLSKHRLDFNDVEEMFDGRRIVTVRSPFQVEDRLLTVGRLNDGKFYTVVWTWRGAARRIISFRRARDGEERAYRQIHGGSVEGEAGGR